HPVPLPRRRRRRGSGTAHAGTPGLRRRRLQRLGPGRPDARPRRPPLAARGQHRAGHDQPLAGAEGRRRDRHRLRRAVLAHPGPDRGGRAMSPRSHARQRVLDRAEVARRSGAPASAATQAEPRIAGWLVQAVAWTLALALVVLPLVGLLNGWFASERWPVRAITINARFERISAEQVQATVAPHASKGFFALRLDEIGTALAGLPWVERVEVRKRWPDTLEVTLHEHRAIARWGTDRLLSDHG